MTQINLRGRGRPRKDANVRPVDNRPDHEVMKDLAFRFSMLSRMSEAAARQNIRSLVVSGAPGIGKTYSIETALSDLNANYTSVAGALSGVELYKLGYEHRAPGSVIVLDDADGIFKDEDALNVLKALCDSSPVRKVSWLKDSATLRQDEVPQSYKFHGSFIFLTNIDMAFHAEANKNKYAPHFQALISRSLYLDLKLHSRQAIALWVNHIATEGGMLESEGVPQTLQDRILSFVQKERDNFRELSLRTILKIIQLAKTNPAEWEMMARVLLCRA